jgi:ribose transport system ATP-binding protein
MNNHPLLDIKGISKAFPGVQALKDVSFSVRAGEVHALVGENGAGKSTLMKILAGVYHPDDGQLYWEGQPLVLANPAAAQHQGISIIYQEFNLLPHLTVAENVLLNHEPRTRFGTLDWSALNKYTRELMDLLETQLDAEAVVGRLSVAQQQIVEIVKALSIDAHLIIMDEPTAALNLTEVGHLFNVIARLKQQGKAVIFISHRLDEILHISDTTTILKDGEVVTSRPTTELNKEQIVRLMVGRQLSDAFPPKATTTAETPILEVTGLSTDRLYEISFKLHPGEVLGLAGLEGHGQRELARALFGLESIHRGQVRVAGKPIRLHGPRDAIKAGIAFVSDDRKADGLALVLSVRENITLPSLSAFGRYGLVSEQQERQAVAQVVETIDVRTPSIEQSVRFLSGGNQQKTVLAKWLLREPRLMVFVEPTRGIDVGAKIEIYHLIRNLANRGAGMLIVSSDLLELLGLSDRILVMHQGHIATELMADAATEEAVMLAATGVIAGAEHG